MSERLGAQLQSGGLGQSIHTGLFGGGLFAGASLDLNFAVTKNIGPLVTFTRASSGTYVGSDGLIKTAAVNEPRFDHNPTTGESLGLLVEEARTNLVLQASAISGSAPWWTQSIAPTITTAAFTAPDGSSNATRVTFAAADSRIIQGTIPVTNGITYTLSLYARPVTAGTLNKIRLACFDSVNQINSNDITLAAGWQRISFTFTSLATGSASINIRNELSASTANDVYIWGAQLEAAAFPTSYIPTTTAAATRSADVASITGTNFSSWYNQTQGTLYAKSAGITTRAFSGASFGIASLNDGTGNNENRLRYRTAGSTGAIVLASNVFQFDSSPTGVLTAPGAASLAVAYAASNFGSAGNGGTPTQGSSGTVPTVSQLQIGADSGGYLNGTISRLSFWPQRLPNSTLQAITQ